MLNTVKAVLAAQTNRLQEAENATFTVLNPLSDATLKTITGDLLDKVGKRVGEKRGGRIDTVYQAAIRIRVRVNRSRGMARDVLAVAILAAVNSIPTYVEYYPASFLVTIQKLPSGFQVSRLLGRTKAAGTYGTLVFTPDTQVATGFTWGDAQGSGTYSASQRWGDALSTSPSVWMCAFDTPKPPGT